MGRGEKVAWDWAMDIIAAADVLAERILAGRPEEELNEAFENYILTRNRHAQPGHGHPAPLRPIGGRR